MQSVLNINLTNMCNFKCITCPQSYHLGHYENPDLKTYEFQKLSKGFMPWDVLRRIPLDYNLIVLQWVGESMMHPSFLEYYEYICKHSQGVLVLNTNAYFLSKKLNKKMVAITERYHKHLILTFSLDSIVQETFSIIKRTNARVNEIIDNIKHFILLKSSNVSVIVQALVLNENFNELFDFFVFWRNFFRENNIRFKVIYSLGEQENNINAYIFFRMVTPETIGKPLMDRFEKIKGMIEK